MSNVAAHIAIIMDGNGRWAQQRHLPRVKGHERGAEVIRHIMVHAAGRSDINTLTLYAFSTENWKRPRLEVDFLMKLLAKYLKKELDFYLKHNVRFKAIGDLSRFSPSLQELIRTTEQKTAHLVGLTQQIALNYGSKDEIVRAVTRLQAQNTPITTETLTQALDNAKEVDVLIRTGGDHRLSNFLLWQAAYAELFFTPTLWPDFTVEEFESILAQFQSIERRFGGL